MCNKQKTQVLWLHISFQDCLLNNRIILKSHQKSHYHNVYTEQINKIALTSNNDKRLQTFDKIATYTYKTNAFKVFENEMQSKYEGLILMIIQMKTKKT